MATIVQYFDVFGNQLLIVKSHTVNVRIERNQLRSETILSWFSVYSPRSLKFCYGRVEEIGKWRLVGEDEQTEGPLRKSNKETFGNIDYSI